MKQRKQLALLAVTCVLFLVALWWGLRETPAGGAGVAPPKGRRSSATKTIDADDIPVVSSLAFQPTLDETFTRNRDLFSYARSPEEIQREQDAQVAAAKAAQVAAAAAEEDRKRRAAEQDVKNEALRKEQEETARRQAEFLRDHPPKPVPPEFRYQYIGVIGPREDSYAILAGSGSVFLYARAGDVIDNMFRVERVGRLKLDIGYTDPRFEDELREVPRVFDSAALNAAPGPVRIPKALR